MWIIQKKKENIFALKVEHVVTKQFATAKKTRSHRANIVRTKHLKQRDAMSFDLKGEKHIKGLLNTLLCYCNFCFECFGCANNNKAEVNTALCRVCTWYLWANAISLSYILCIWSSIVWDDRFTSTQCISVCMCMFVCIFVSTLQRLIQSRE